MRASAAKIDVVQSWSYGVLRSAVESFAAKFPELLVLLPGTGFIALQNTVGVHRLTFLQLARQLAQPQMAEDGIAPLGHLGSEALAARVIFRARQQSSISYFSPVAGLPGFSRALARTLRELRLAGTSPEALAKGAAPARDLGVLLADYELELGERGLADVASVMAMARDAVDRGEHRWAGLPIAALDVHLESQAHHDLFDALIRKSPQALVAELGAPLGKTEKPKDVLAHLRANLFQPSSEAFTEVDGRFEFFSAPGEGLEAVEIARRILRLVREGVNFDQVAILLRNPERYQPMVEDALRRAGIPAHFTRGTSRPDPSGRAFLALLGCAAENLSASRFAEYMSLGQIPSLTQSVGWVPPEGEGVVELKAEPVPESDRPTPRRWEQYLVDAAVIGGRDRWERRLLGLEAEWELNAEENAERLTQLRNLRDFALPLVDALAALPRAAAWRDWLAALGGLAQRALRAPEGVLAILAEFEPMGDVGPATLEEVIEVLSDRLRFLRAEPAQHRWGRVFVGSIDEARGREFGTVFLPGLAEGLFPQRISEDPLLLDEFRKVVDEHLRLRPDAVHEERQRLHMAVGTARDRLIASYPRMEVAEARPRVPSFYALELPRAIYGAVPELNLFERQAREAAPARLNWPAPKNRAEAIDDTEFDLTSIAAGSAQHILKHSEAAARSLRARWFRWHPKWRPSDGFVASEAVTLDLLGAERLTARSWSPSSLENFAVCPYKFALHGIFKLRTREESAPLEQLDPMTRGSVFHEVQSRLYEELRDSLPVTMANLKEAMAKLETVIAKVAAEYAEKLVPAIPRVWESEIDGLRTDLRGWLHFTASNEYDWTPVEFELPFEEELPELVKLRGRIDAVEARGDLRRVTDYKTGKAPDVIPRWTGGGKHLQPLLYALAAEQKLGAKVDSGRLLYATQKGNFTTIEIRLDDRARAFLGKLLGNIDARIVDGFLPPVPDKDACGYCDYRIVCGPYEERRALMKDRGDERLDTLYEIRGMA
ncbi:MAG: PD-(D/E)XK nuclease family protein [Bryobacteraceae bacterium]